MDLATRGLVIREQPVGESGKLLTLLTRDAGVVRAFVHGVRKSGSALAAPCSLYALSDFVLVAGKTRGRDRDAYTVRSADLQNLFPNLQTDLTRLALCGYLSELAAAVTPSDPSAADFLRLLLNSIHLLCTEKYPAAQIKASFELRIMSYAGYMPDVIGCRGCRCYEAPCMYYVPREQAVFCEECIASLPNVERIPMPPATLTAMRHILLTEPERMFSFTVSEQSLHALSQIAERHVLLTLDRRFQTLSFYHSIASM